MTDTAVRPSTARYLSDAALLADLHTLHGQLDYADAFELKNGVETLRAEVASDRLGVTWSALNDEAESRGLVG